MASALVAANGQDTLAQQIANASRIPALRKHLDASARARQLPVPSLPTLGQLIQLASAAEMNSASWSGAIYGGRLGLRIEDQLSLTDGPDLPGLDIGIPVLTAITQTLKWSALVYRGQLDLATAATRVVVTVTSVGFFGAVGAVVGSAVLPGIGTVIGGALGGMLGGKAGKSFSEAEYRRAKDSYLRAHAAWTQHVEASRCAGNRHLQGAVRAARKHYLRHVRRTPHFGLGLRQRSWQRLCLGGARMAERSTRAWLSWRMAQWLRGRFARTLSEQNRRALAALQQRELCMRGCYANALNQIDATLNATLEHHSRLVESMVSNLNVHAERLASAMRRLGWA
jgi:outer membrane lipoprotein SlyB